MHGFEQPNLRPLFVVVVMGFDLFIGLIMAQSYLNQH